MRLFILAIGDRTRASSRLRVWDHIEYFRQQGILVQADYFAHSTTVTSRAALALRVIRRLPFWIVGFVRAEVIYLQETMILWPLVALAVRFSGKNIIFDFSDPVDAIGNGLKLRLRKKAFDCLVNDATHVIVENRFYQKSLKRHCVHQFYGPVNVKRYQEFCASAQPRAGPLRIGWTGSPGTVHFIEPLFPILDSLSKMHSIELVLVGVSQPNYNFLNLPVTCVLWKEETEFFEVPMFDLGLHRIDLNPVSYKRGAGKIFVYMAAGVPFITDAHGIGADVVYESQLGFLVNNQSWEAGLKLAVTSDRKRLDYAKRGICYARREMSYQAYRVFLSAIFRQK